MEKDLIPKGLVNWWDIAKGVGHVMLTSVTEHIQNPTPSEHHFEHPPVTDRPATYTWPHDSEGTPV